MYTYIYQRAINILYPYTQQEASMGKNKKNTHTHTHNTQSTFFYASNPMTVPIHAFFPESHISLGHLNPHALLSPPLTLSSLKH